MYRSDCPSRAGKLKPIGVSRALAIGPRAAEQAPLQALRQLQQLGQAQEAIENLQRQYLAVEKAIYAQAASSAIVAPSASDTVRSKAEPSAKPGDEANALSAKEPALTITVESKDDLELLNKFCNKGRDLLHQVGQGSWFLSNSPNTERPSTRNFEPSTPSRAARGFLGWIPSKN